MRKPKVISHSLQSKLLRDQLLELRRTREQRLEELLREKIIVRLMELRRLKEQVTAAGIETARRHLLYASVIGLIGIVPTNIEALGLEFSNPEEFVFFVVMAGIVIYLLINYHNLAQAPTQERFNIWKTEEQPLQDLLDQSWHEENLIYKDRFNCLAMKLEYNP